ncbi:lysophospholipase, putative [Plasmodium gaboni]|uniref:Lysophospholipase, putative n=1 Tax=Plasmodium gaboni TaxID=647221 RepID=A0ABY0KW55_9APIC|nr:lysophospholipase, putative [Plasmodium gaboni]
MSTKDICVDESSIPTCRVDSFFNKDGLSIRNYSWTVKKAIGLIILIHGLTTHMRLAFLKHNVNIVSNNHAELVDADNYYLYEGSWIEQFNKNGYSVYGIDLQGHGESDGYDNLRLHVNNFDDYAGDVIEYIKKVNASISSEQSILDEDTLDNDKSKNRKKLPIYILGSSMGGNVVLRALEILGESNEDLSKLNIKGCISLSGMVSITKIGSIKSLKYRLYYLPGINLLSSICSTCRTSQGKVKFEKYPFIEDILSYDKYRYKGDMTNKLAYGIVKCIDTLHKNIKSYPSNIPVLFIHSKNDTICDYGDVESFYKGLHNVNKELYALEDMDHDLIAEPGNENVLKKIIQWMNNKNKN